MNNIQMIYSKKFCYYYIKGNTFFINTEADLFVRKKNGYIKSFSLLIKPIYFN
jgi:hypothetical protein